MFNWSGIMAKLFQTEQPHLTSTAEYNENGIITLNSIFPLVKTSKPKKRIKAYTFSNDNFIVHNGERFHCRTQSEMNKGDIQRVIEDIRTGGGLKVEVGIYGSVKEFYNYWKGDSKVVKRHC